MGFAGEGAVRVLERRGAGALARRCGALPGVVDLEGLFHQGNFRRIAADALFSSPGRPFSIPKFERSVINCIDDDRSDQRLVRKRVTRSTDSLLLKSSLHHRDL